MYARCPLGAGAAGGAPEGALEARRAVRGLPAGGKREGVGRGRKGSARYVLLICVVYISSLICETYGAHRVLCCSGQLKGGHGSAPSGRHQTQRSSGGEPTSIMTKTVLTQLDRKTVLS